MDADHYLPPFFLGSAGMWQCQATHVCHFITQAQVDLVGVAQVGSWEKKLIRYSDC